MDWARDLLGRDVFASECETRRGLFCPTCGEPVVRRAGKSRRPYYAHKNHCAKPECENYHPSDNSSPFLTWKDLQVQQNPSKNPSLTGGIFLQYSESGNHTLYLKLPRLALDKESSGTIELTTGLGVRNYFASQLLKSRLVRVTPKIPLVEVKVSWGLSSLEADIKENIKTFKNFGNYFKANEAGGRLLGREESLEWGEQYFLLTQIQLEPSPTISGLKIIAIDCWKEWTLYDIALPFFLDIKNEVERNVLSRFLGRTIKAPVPHIFFSTPPHHLEFDGTYVYPEGTEKIVIRKTGPGRIIVQETKKPIIKDLNDEWTEISGFEMGNFSILVDGREELLGKIEKCDLFQPEGVRVNFDGTSREIFESGLNTIIQHKAIENLHIECPSLRVSNLLNLEQNLWFRVENSYTARETGCRPVDAANFGFLAWPIDENSIVKKSYEVNGKKDVRRIWLEGIIARHYGPEVLLQFRNELSDTSFVGCPEMAIEKLAWLLPYFRLIKETNR